MDIPQVSPKHVTVTDVRLDEYISYVAVGGLITEDDGSFKRMSLEEFADKLDVDRKTLFNWKKTVPDFWDRVDAKRSELFSRNRITAVWNGLYLRAAAGGAEQAKIILGQYAAWQPPSQRHEVTIGGLIDLAREAETKGIIEAEIVEQPGTNNPG